jgi:hypothetical protein
MREDIYLWGCSFRYRGHLICPIEVIGGYKTAVLDPFGQEIGDTETDRILPSTEETWRAGRRLVNENLTHLEADAPELLAQIPQGECHRV